MMQMKEARAWCSSNGSLTFNIWNALSCLQSFRQQSIGLNIWCGFSCCTEEQLVDCSNTALQFLGHSSCLLCLQLPGDLINLRVWFCPLVKNKNMSGNNLKNIFFANLTPCSRDQCKAFHWPGLRIKKMGYKCILSHIASTRKNACAHVRAAVRKELFTWLAKAFACTFSSFFLHCSFTHTSF